MVTLLPSVPNEQTSLNVSENLEFIEDVVEVLRANNIVSSILIDPDAGQIRAAARAGVDYVQLNTLPLSSVEDLGTLSDQIENIRSVSMAANKLGLGVSVGYGLNYQNIRELLDISTIEEINIGRAIIARSLLIGIEKAVQQIKNVTAST
jgi:pyridoxine 5-phosphate synthase